MVSHGSAIRLLLAELLGIPSREIGSVPYCDNTAVARLTAEGDRLTLVSYNDNSHLPEALSAFHRDEWWKNEDGKDGRDMYFLPMDLDSLSGQQTYLRRYRETWIASYGSDRGFTSVHLDGARYRQQQDRNSVLEAWCEESPCGILELAFRDRGLGIQLIGAAVSYYRALGRKKLRLRVTVGNEAALRFYRRWGFTEERRENGLYGETLVMTKDIP